MKHKNPRHPTRRQFLGQTGAVAGVLAAGLAGLDGCALSARDAGGPTGVALAADPQDPAAATAPAQWALGHLRKTLEARNVRVRMIDHPSATGQNELCILAAGRAAAHAAAGDAKLPEEPESLALIPGRQMVLATGGDAQGLVYALTELADRVEHGPDPYTALHVDSPFIERPANRIRSVIRLFVSELEDKPWFYDHDFWQRYLTMLVTHRFNRFNLSLGLGYDFSRGIVDSYFFFAYPFLVTPPGYNVRAVSPQSGAFPEEERARNLAMLGFISDEAARRGLHFQLGLWTHSYQWTNSPNVNFNIEGLDAQTQAPYSRDALRMVLEACPGIRGITLRTHGESGVPEGSYDIWKTIMSGVTGLKNADGTARVVELDLHAKSITAEMIETARGTGMPVTISPKFTAEHMGLPYMEASIRPQEAPRRDAGGLMSLSNGSRNFLRYSFGDLLRTDRKYQVITRVWPGTQRLLLWGDPLYAAEYGRTWSFCGMDGVEYCDPLTFKGRQGSGQKAAVEGAGRSGYADAALVPAGGDWEKYLYQYRLLGRLSYNPDAPAESWQRALKFEFGSAAAGVEGALANASRILPMITTAHVPAAANAAYWPEVYVNMSLYDASKVGPYREAPSPKIFENVTAIDPQLFASVGEYVESLISGKALGKITPLEVAAQLETWSREAGRLVAAAVGSGGARSAGLQRVEVDVRIMAGIGMFFAEKLRAAVTYGIYERTGYLPARKRAVEFYKRARYAWARFLPLAEASYVSDLAFGWERQLRGCWSDRLPEIDLDIAGVEQWDARTEDAPLGRSFDRVMDAFEGRTHRLSIGVEHKARRQFHRALPIELAIGLPGANFETRVWYRHVNQGEVYRWASMGARQEAISRTSVATIAADYAETAYPVQYYFEVSGGASELPALVPGFGKDFVGQPYFVMEPTDLPGED